MPATPVSRNDEPQVAISEAFAREPERLCVALGLRIDTRKKPGVWVYDGLEEDASLQIQTNGRYAGTWTRFGSGESGNAFQLVRRQNPGMTFRDAVAFLAEVYGIEDAPPARRERKPPAKVVGSTVYKLRDAEGNLVAEHHRLDREDGTKTVWWERGGKRGLADPETGEKLPTADLPLYGIADVVGGPFGGRGAVVVTEGEKARDALDAQNVLAVGTVCGAGTQPTEKVLAPLLGRTVLLWPDNDDVGRQHMDGIARTLRALGHQDVRLLAPPGLPDHGDAADFYAAGGTTAEVRDLIKGAPPYPEGPVATEEEAAAAQARRSMVKVRIDGTLLCLQTEQALEALIAANQPEPRLFVRAGAVARICPDEEGRPRIEPLGSEGTFGELSYVCDFWKAGKGGDEVSVTCPQAVVTALGTTISRRIEAGGWPFPNLRGVTECPVVRPDGTILQTPGYDPATALCYRPAAGFKMRPVPDQPTEDECADARALLDEAVCDFPFSDPASYENLLGLLLTAVLRPAITGPVPLCLIGAPNAGTGKSLLAEVASLIVTGRDAHLFGAPVAEEEWRKALTSALQTGASMICIDNVDHGLGSSSLARALTAEVYADRILGQTQTVALPVRCTWIATGNNMALQGDLPRRCYSIDLDTKSSEPHRGRTFRHDPLKPWVREHRSELLRALLTLARAWYANGCPEATTPRLGSYEGWSAVVGGVLTMFGCTEFLGNLEDLYEAQAGEAQEWEAFLAAWHETWGDEPLTAEEAAARITEGFEAHPVGEVLPLALVPRSPAEAARRLGYGLRKVVGRRFGADGMRVENAGRHPRNRRTRWVVRHD